MNDGKHLGGFKYRNRRSRNSGKLVSGSIITTTLALVAKDLLSDNSKIIQLGRKLILRIPSKSEINPKIIDAEFKQIKDKE